MAHKEFRIEGAGLRANDTIVIDNTGSFGAGLEQDNFQSFAVSGQTTVSPNSFTDTLEFVAGTNVTLTTNATNKTITIASSDINTTYSAGNGISLTGTVFSVAGGTGLTQDASGLSITAGGVGTTQLADNSVNATKLNVADNGTAGLFLQTDGDGSFSWATPTDTNTTYTAGSGISLTGTTFAVAAGTSLTQDAGGLSVTAKGIDTPQIADNAIDALQLNVSGNGTTSQWLRSDGDGTFSWVAPPNDNTTYSAGNGIALSGTTFSVAAGTGLTQDASGLSISNGDITQALIGDSAIGTGELRIRGFGSAGQFIASKQNGDFIWATPPNDNTTYSPGTLLDLSGTTFNVDLSEATEAAVAVATDYLLFLDGGATGSAAKESITDFVTAITGTNLTASGSQVTVTDATIRSKISVSGDLSYNSSTGVISYTDSDQHTTAEIRAMLSGGTGISYNSTTGVITTSDAGIVHDNLSGFVANEHIDHTSISVTAGTGLTGGGTIAATRTINVIGGKGIIANANDIQVDSANIRGMFSAAGDLSYASGTGIFTFNETYSTAAELLTAIKTVDGATSGLDADLLDGQHGSYYRIDVYDAAGSLIN